MSRLHADMSEGVSTFSAPTPNISPRARSSRRPRPSAHAAMAVLLLGAEGLASWCACRELNTRAVCEHAEAGTPARGDHVNSDVVQSVLHVSSVCQTRRALLSCARQDRPLTSARDM